MKSAEICAFMSETFQILPLCTIVFRGSLARGSFQQRSQYLEQLVHIVRAVFVFSVKIDLTGGRRTCVFVLAIYKHA